MKALMYEVNYTKEPDMKLLKDMTAEELLTYSMSIVPRGEMETIGLLHALHSKLEDILMPNPNEIHIVWSVEDVFNAAEVMGEEFMITREQAREVLRRINASHDAEIGVTWHTIEETIKAVLEGR